MTARKSKRRTRKPTRRGSKPQKLTRVGTAPSLTRAEIRELKARAAADLRTISNYVSYLVMAEVKRKGRRRSPLVTNPGEKRRPYALQLFLTAAKRRRLEAAAKVERRSVSGYVGRVIVAELATR